MARSYVIASPSRAAGYDGYIDGEEYLARTVFEDREMIDIGVLDKDGNKIMAYQKPEPIGFIRWRNG